jgi:ribokinase
MAVERPVVTVVGSVHMDLIAIADRLPGRGESLIGHTFAAYPGGKAGNQAAQVAANDCRARIVTRLGDDHFGRELRARLEAKGVDTSRVVIDRTVPTGASLLLVGGDGEYASIIVPAAAARLSEADVDAACPAFANSAVVMLQMEIPIGVTAYTARVAHEAGALVVFNASPAPHSTAQIPHDLWDHVDLLVVNALEAERLGAPPGVDAATGLRTQFDVPTVVVTLGAAGAVAAAADGTRRVPAWKVEVVDTIGAGDAFVGSLVAELGRGAALKDALSFATAAGALAVTRPGAFDALPSRAETLAFIAGQSLAR